MTSVRETRWSHVGIRQEVLSPGESGWRWWGRINGSCAYGYRQMCSRAGDFLSCNTADGPKFSEECFTFADDANIGE